MKTHVSFWFQTLTFALTCFFPQLTHAANGKVTQRGPSQLQLETRSQIDPAEIAPTTTGTMRLQYQEKGQARKQSLQILGAGLDTNSPVSLTAAIGSDTDVTTVLSSQTDQRGRVLLSFQSKEPSRRQPRGEEPLPDVLSPLTQVRAICIENAALQVVGFAWVANASTYRYIVRRNLTPTDSNSTAAGSIKLIANQNKVSFTLLAGGLAPAGSYSLVLNQTPVLSTTADNNGRLRIRQWPTNAPAVLDLRALALADDAGGTTVLSTTLPE
jgi:hypothetical protein